MLVDCFHWSNMKAQNQIFLSCNYLTPMKFYIILHVIHKAYKHMYINLLYSYTYLCLFDNIAAYLHIIFNIINIQLQYNFTKHNICSIDVKRDWSLMAWLEKLSILTVTIFIQTANVMVPVFSVYRGGQEYFPIVAGYASTIHKVMGQKLQHVTLAFDTRMLSPALWYKALSRVSSLDNVVPLLPLRKSHFINF